MYTAIIIEFRKHPAFQYVLHNVFSNLSDDWTFIVFHGNLNGDYVKESTNVTERIKFVHLPYDNMFPWEYSRLLINPDIIYPEITTEMFLVFQTDSCIISKNKAIINDFIKYNYDYVGAPWNSTSCGNGGFSLRKKSKMLEIIMSEDPSRHSLPEDLFFSQAKGINLPDGELASRFSIEDYIGCGNSFACHKPWNNCLAYCRQHDEIITMMRYNGINVHGLGILNIIYRISSSTNTKNRPDYFSKEKCFMNFIKVFSTDNVFVVADNCTAEMLTFLLKYINKSNLIQTNLGNSRSFIYSMNFALSNFYEYDSVYFVEDDYLHLPNSKYILKEGLCLTDYITGYDHPDKYIDNGSNPYISQGGEVTRVLLSKSRHWKLTNSTTMSFLTRIKTLREDKDIIEHFCRGDIPEDFNMFCFLIQNKGRKLISALPGITTHMETDHLAPLIEWSNI